MCFTYTGGMHHHRHRGRHGRGPRTRWLVEPGRWAVRARIERFVEPAVLLLLSEGPRHGYELLDRLPELVGDERVDVGNLYRVMRALEQEGIVESEWSGDLPGPAKRTYRLTAEGRQVLERWVEALRAARDEISSFVDRYESEVG
jgi:PadR family transcriptional regulator, regulatory protein PadR